MRTVISSSCMRLACRAALLALLAGAGCSSDFTRFGSGLSSTAPADTGQVYSNQENPYPEYLDNTTTSTVGGVLKRRPVPTSDVSASSQLSEGETGQSEYSPYNTPSPASNYGSAPYQQVTSSSGIVRSDLPTPTGSSSSRTDPASTSAVSTGASSRSGKRPANGDGGWSASGGTVVTLREGETLYNLSKRYGVPVQEIMKASNVANASQVQAGQKIVIPIFVFSSDAPISAPDNNEKTRNARASTGTLSEPDHASHASNSAGDGNYVVKSGDTLSRIARENGTTVDAIVSANRLSGTMLRTGQKLVMPSGATRIAAVSTKHAVDTVPTDSPDRVEKSAPDGPKSYVKPEKPVETAKLSTDEAAPSRTGIGDFRWPARGRVIANFKDKTSSGRNDGIDISVPEGTAVKAAENGVVVYAGNELEGYGNLILIRHSDGWVSAYAHNKTLEVKRGDEVQRGEIVARSGRTGDTTTPRLHFELRKDSTPVDPLKYLGSV
jgi:murein DD-endopeptidase MepM/ murein hydrolase activator NlpD